MQYYLTQTKQEVTLILSWMPTNKAIKDRTQVRSNLILAARAATPVFCSKKTNKRSTRSTENGFQRLHTLEPQHVSEVCNIGLSHQRKGAAKVSTPSNVNTVTRCVRLALLWFNYSPAGRVFWQQQRGCQCSLASSQSSNHNNQSID